MQEIAIIIIVKRKNMLIIIENDNLSGFKKAKIIPEAFPKKKYRNSRQNYLKYISSK